MDAAIAFKWFIFLSTALLTLFSSVMMVTRRNPIHSALWLIVAFFCLGIIYLTLNAQFIAVAQVMVYAGAIMMLILFVIMLIHLEKETVEAAKFSAGKAVGAFITVILFLEVAAGVISYRVAGQGITAGPSPTGAVGTVGPVGALLYGQYLFPFEIASILLLVGIIGAVILAKRRDE